MVHPRAARTRGIDWKQNVLLIVRRLQCTDSNRAAQTMKFANYVLDKCLSIFSTPTVDVHREKDHGSSWLMCCTAYASAVLFRQEHSNIPLNSGTSIQSCTLKVVIAATTVFGQMGRTPQIHRGKNCGQRNTQCQPFLWKNKEVSSRLYGQRTCVSMM